MIAGLGRACCPCIAGAQLWQTSSFEPSAAYTCINVYTRPLVVHPNTRPTHNTLSHSPLSIFTIFMCGYRSWLLMSLAPSLPCANLAAAGASVFRVANLLTCKSTSFPQSQPLVQGKAGIVPPSPCPTWGRLWVTQPNEKPVPTGGTTRPPSSRPPTSGRIRGEKQQQKFVVQQQQQQQHLQQKQQQKQKHLQQQRHRRMYALRCMLSYPPPLCPPSPYLPG